MIRVIYEWKVKPENLEAFGEAWQQATTLVREVYPGAHGSSLLQDEDNITHVLTVARWNSRDDWGNFWTSDNPPEVLKMGQLAKLVSVKLYDEIGYTA